ncbi:MAG TPA: ABC transporter ATP-binding protein, partial [Acidimicrobiales bacterium]|nr:ABC transporter ATP-binding protein [Acidimicrobiales bacterium]
VSDAASRLGEYPHQFSGGMRQRVMIAMALSCNPELLIADEPTTALDVTTQAEVLDLLRQLQQQRAMALLLITHDLRVAFSVCDRVLVMYAGSVMEDAPAGELSRSSRHPYSLGLLRAEPPVSHFVEQLNAIPGTVPAADAVADRCAFAERCEWCAPVCVAARPPLRLVAPGHLSACTRLEDIGTELIAGQRRLFVPAEPAAPPSGAPLLTVHALSKDYRISSLVAGSRTTRAVHGVSFEIVEGEALGLVGETGSGKTTIARCILGLAEATSGSIVLGGLEVTKRHKLSRDERRSVVRLVQGVFQDPYSSLNPMRTVGATLAEAAAVRGEGRLPQGEVDRLLELVGLPATYATRRPAALSGGERQRVAIARALAVRPKLLVCDEPVAALDVSVQAQILELLRSLREREGTSMLFITHDLAVVRQMTDRIVVLLDGDVVERGHTQEVLDAPSHAYTTRLVGSIPGDVPVEPGTAPATPAVATCSVEARPPHPQ